jgi:O-antigen/teichoic acid export membrane protein
MTDVREPVPAPARTAPADRPVPNGPTEAGPSSTLPSGGLSSTSALGPGGVAVAAAGLVVNALAYVVPLLGARTLAPADLGALAVVLALGAFASVPAQGLQTAIAVRRARHGAVRRAGRASLATAAVTGAVLGAAVPVVSRLLHVAPILPVWSAATGVAVVLASRWLGELQGAQRFGRLAVGMVALAVARYGGVIAGLGLGAGVAGSLAWGAAVAWLVPPVLALLARQRSAAPAGGTVPAGETAPAGEPVRAGDILAATGATLAMLAASYADLVLARHALTGPQSGAYAVGAVLTKGALWAPQVVTVLALPMLARGSRRALVTSVGVVGLCGAVLVVASWVAGTVVIERLGGSGYAWLGRYAAGFAAVGALYAVVFVLVNAQIAAGSRWPAAPLWLSLAAFAVAVRLLDPPTIGRILGLAVAAGVLATALMALALARAVRRPRPASRHRRRS